MAATAVATGSPMQSETSATGWPRSSARRGVMGARENFASKPPLGLPKWEERITLAPLLVKYLMVGIAPLIRVSSVITPFSRGTLKSARTKTLQLSESKAILDRQGTRQCNSDDESTKLPVIRHNYCLPLAL